MIVPVYLGDMPDLQYYIDRTPHAVAGHGGWMVETHYQADPIHAILGASTAQQRRKTRFAIEAMNENLYTLHLKREKDQFQPTAAEVFAQLVMGRHQQPDHPSSETFARVSAQVSAFHVDKVKDDHKLFTTRAWARAVDRKKYDIGRVTLFRAIRPERDLYRTLATNTLKY